MTEQEFWSSTLAKVMALKNYHQEQNKTRDYFTAKIVAVTLNSYRSKSDHYFTPEEILEPFYPGTVMLTPEDEDDVMGAFIDGSATALLRGSSHA